MSHFNAIIIYSSIIIGPMKAIFSPSKLGIFLSKLAGFETPKVRSEQYQTDPQIAGEIIHQATLLGDIFQKKVIDFGAGTGILGLGCALAQAKEIIMIEQDQDAIKVCEQNINTIKEIIQNSGLESPKITLKHAKIAQFRGKSETLMMNPPFGTKQKHADRAFLIEAFKKAPVIYTFAKSNTARFIHKVSLDHGFKVTHAWRYERFPLKKTQHFHKKPIKYVDITVFRLKSESYSG